LKTNFILTRIAEREKIEVTREELDRRVRQEAGRGYDVSVEKSVRNWSNMNGSERLTEQILLGQTLVSSKRM